MSKRKRDKTKKKPAPGRILGKISDLRQNATFNYIMLTFAGICAGLTSLLLGATVFGLSAFWLYFSSPMVILLNLLPPILLILLFYFISGRAWIAFTIPSFFTLIFSLIHFFKVQIRGDPFVVSDLLLIREVSDIIAPYSLTMNWKVYLAIIGFVCGVAFSIFFLKHKPKRGLFRIIASVAAAAVCFVLYTAVYTNQKLYSTTTGDATVNEWSPTRKYIAKGFLYPFIHGIKDTIADARGQNPDWYDAEEARRMLESYDNTDIPEGKKVNIIVVMLESYSDLSCFDSLDFKSDVYGPLHRLEEESVTGKVVTNTFSGGTTDAERLFLTGNTRLTSFTSPSNSYIRYLRSQGYYTEGLHSGDMWFYDRRPVNAQLGFENYYFLEDYENGSRYDWFFFPAVATLYKERDAGKPYFSYNLSYQNHGPYDSVKTREPYYIERNGMSDESFNILNNYLIGISDTTKRIETFIDELRDDAEPVVVVVFGDHMPWLGNLNSVYLELGVNIDRGSEEGYLNYYSTPYIIWANDAAKAVLGSDFTGEGGSFSPCFLMGEVFEQCSWEGEGYMQALRELQESIDVINAPLPMYRENGALTDKLTPESAAALQRLRMMEIYRRSNF